MATRHQLGRAGEEIACRYLQGKGYRILDRNVVFRSRGIARSELDVVAAAPDGTIVVVEVKTRSAGHGGELPEAAVTAHKIRALTIGAQRYLRDRGTPDAPLRFDALAVSVDTAARCARVRHLRDVFLSYGA